jgi:CRISPR type IV-associated protein Csf3
MIGPGLLVPLRVRARLATGIAQAAPWGIALDGLLAAEAWADRKASLRAAGTPSPALADTADPEDLDLPLARCAAAGPGLWHWAATCAFPEGRATELPDVRYWTGRPDERAAGQAAAALPAIISARQGRYRARRMPLLVTVCASVTWYAVGDPDVIARTVASLMAIGKKRGCGEGQVLSWEVQPLPGVSVWEAGHLHPDGTLGRPCPPACLAGHPAVAGLQATAGLRPPYMHPARQHQLVLPALLDG